MRTLRRLFTALSLLCLAGITPAQDVIVKKDQSTVMSKVLEITNNEIKYKKWSNQDGPTYSIGKSEVLSINYENGEVENFFETTNIPQQNNPSQFQNNNLGYMEAHTGFPASLKLNGRKIYASEVQGLVDIQNYQLFLKGREQSDIGNFLSYASILPFVCSGVGLQQWVNNIDKDKEKASRALTITIASFLVGTAMVIPGFALSIKGSDKLKQVAKNYNHAQNKSYSLNLSPTFINCETPQPQDNYGLGLTLSINF